MTAVMWCHLGDCDRERTARLLGLNNPDLGVVALPGVVDSHKNAGWFARDMLVALGKPSHLAGNESYSVDPWTVVPLWFTAAGVQHLVVVDAQRLGEGRVADLIGLACETGLTLWLFTHDRLRGIWDTELPDWPVQRVEWNDIEHRLPVTEHAPTPQRTGPGFTLDELPASDLWTFRADCQRTLPPKTFADVDELFNTVVAESAEWVPGRTREEIEDRIQWLLGEYPTVGERLVALRAFQVGVLRGGWHVGVAYDGFAAYAGEHPGRVVHDEDHRWKRLHRWWQPHRGAVCALVAMGIDADTVAQLAMSAVEPEVVHTPDEDLVVPAPAQAILTAQRLARLAEGAAPTDPFFVTGDATDGATWVTSIVSSAVDAGAAIPVPGAGPRQRWHNSGELTARLGLKITSLAAGGLAAPADVTGGDRVFEPSPGPGGADEASPLDGRFLARRRLELGLTRRQLARAAGVNDSVVNALERGELPPLMKASSFARYAQALAMHPAELFGGAPPAPPTHEPADDTAALGALLWSCDQATPRSAVADALGWDAGRVNKAAEALDGQLRSAGLRLLAGPGELSIVAEASSLPPADQVATAVRRQQLRGAVSLHRVKVLLDIANGDFRANRNANGATMAHLLFLQRGEMITYPTGSATPTPSDDVAFSLCVAP